MHIKHHYAATTLAVVFLVAMVALVASKYQFANNQVSSTTGVLSTYQNAQNALSNKASTLAQNVSTLSSKLTSSNATIQADANEIASLQSELSAAESKVSSLSTDAAAISSMNASLQMYKSFYASQISTISAQLTQIASLNSVASNLNSTLHNLDANFVPTNFTNVGLPAVFNTSSPQAFLKYSILTTASWNGSYVLAVGGNFSDYPIAGLYNPISSKWIDLSQEIPYKELTEAASASGAGNFMIAFSLVNKSLPSGYGVGMLEYSNGKFINLASTLPKRADFVPLGMSYNGKSYLIVGYYPNTATQEPVSAAMFSYTPSGGLVNLTIPSNLSSGSAFFSAAWNGSEYGILDVNNNTPAATYHGSSVNIVMYNPTSNTFSSYNISNTNNAVNWGNGGIAWDGAKFLVINAIEGGFTTGFFDPITHTYTNITSTVSTLGGVPTQGLAWTGYEFFIPGLSANGESAFLFKYS